jgi:hypothetical protein
VDKEETPKYRKEEIAKIMEGKTVVRWEKERKEREEEIGITHNEGEEVMMNGVLTSITFDEECLYSLGCDDDELDEGVITIKAENGETYTTDSDYYRAFKRTMGNKIQEDLQLFEGDHVRITIIKGYYLGSGIELIEKE